MAKLSEPSATMSYCAISASALAAVSRSAWAATFDVRIEPRDRGGGAVDFRPADIGRAVDHLALQIGQRHRVVVDHAERADARRREIQQHRRAEPAGADHQHAGAAQRRLAGAADLAQHDVAGVTFEFLGRQHGIAFFGHRRKPVSLGSYGRRTVGHERFRLGFGNALFAGSPRFCAAFVVVAGCSAAFAQGDPRANPAPIAPANAGAKPSRRGQAQTEPKAADKDIKSRPTATPPRPRRSSHPGSRTPMLRFRAAIAPRSRTI